MQMIPLSAHDAAELIARLRAAQDAATDEKEKNNLRAKRLRLEAGEVRETALCSLIREMGGHIEFRVTWRGVHHHVFDRDTWLKEGKMVCAECGANLT